MQLKLRRLANWSGTIIASLAVIYVAYMFKEYSNQMDFSRFSGYQWITFGFLAMIYGAANFFLTFSWKSILGYLSAPISLETAVRVFGISQLAKYLPGNIFHLAGRQALGMAHGIPALVLVKSAVWELVLIALVGSLFGILILPVFFTEINLYISLGGFLLVLTLAGWGLLQLFGKNILHAYISYLVFLSISGVIFASLLAIVSNGYESHYHYVIAAFVIAWLAGLITPGAPAGIGVRELVLLFLLKGVIAEPDILIAVILGRLVSVLGDLIFYIAAFFITKDITTNE